MISEARDAFDIICSEVVVEKLITSTNINFVYSNDLELQFPPKYNASKTVAIKQLNEQLFYLTSYYGR